MKMCAHGGIAKCNAGCYAKGGEVKNEKLHPGSSHLMDHKSLVESLMKKKMAKGGLVDNSNDLDIDSDEAQGVELANGLTHHADFLSDAENDEPLDLHMPEYEAEEEHEGQHGRGILDKILSGVRKRHMLG